MANKLKKLLICAFKPRPLLQRKLWLNFSIAVITILLVHFNENIPILQMLKDKMLDTIMYWHSDFIPRLKDGEEMQRMVLFTIDEASYRAWGSPLLTPRDKLKNLIEQAVVHKANVIAIDLSLSWQSDGCIHGDDNTPACLTADQTADAALGEYLQELNNRQEQNSPIIVLTRLYRKPLDENGYIKETNFVERVPSFLDHYLPEEKNVFWASTFFQIDSDLVRRRWELVSLVCENQRLTVVPSMQLLVAFAHLQTTKQGNTRKAAEGIRALKEQWQQWAAQFSCQDHLGQTVPQLCAQYDAARFSCQGHLGQMLPQLCAQYDACKYFMDFMIELPKKNGVSDETRIVSLKAGGNAERVIYRFAPADKPQGERLSLLFERSADKILTGQQDVSDVEQNIVFIGTTHQGSYDRHPIPIRTEPVDGVYILANAVDTLLRFGQITSEPNEYKIIIYLAVVVIATWIFTAYEVITAYFFSLIGLGFALYLWSIQALGHGLEIDVALPLLTFQLLVLFWHLAENFWEMIERCQHHAQAP